MVVDLSKYDGDSFEAALDVFYGVVDDLKIQAADGRLTITDLEGYRSRIVRETYSKLAEMKQSVSGPRDNPEQSCRPQRSTRRRRSPARGRRTSPTCSSSRRWKRVRDGQEHAKGNALRVR